MDDEEYFLEFGDKKGHFHERVAEWGQNKRTKIGTSRSPIELFFFFWLFETVPRLG